MKSFNNMIADGDTYEDMLPYERFLKSGPESLTDAELLAIIIRTGANSSSPVDIARNVLQLGNTKEKGLNSLYVLSIDELMKVHGVGKVKAIMLKSVAELAKRMSIQRASVGISFDNPERIASFYMERLRHEDREKVLVLSLNNKLKLISETTLSMGTVNSAIISPRDIFIEALRSGASSIVMLHNHPSGDPAPSRADISITNKIRESGSMLDINLKDHIIIGDQSYYSFLEKGLLWQ